MKLESYKYEVTYMKISCETDKLWKFYVMYLHLHLSLKPSTLYINHMILNYITKLNLDEV